jgi:hypothetical protein
MSKGKYTRAEMVADFGSQGVCSKCNSEPVFTAKENHQVANISTVPFEGAVEGNVELGQTKFSLEGQDWVLLTATPTT